jgi:hypothetical protein
MQTDQESAADADNRSALSAIALEMASMGEGENLEDSAEVKFELPAVSRYCRFLIEFDLNDAVKVTRISISSCRTQSHQELTRTSRQNQGEEQVERTSP